MKQKVESRYAPQLRALGFKPEELVFSSRKLRLAFEATMRHKRKSKGGAIPTFVFQEVDGRFETQVIDELGQLWVADKRIDMSAELGFMTMSDNEIEAARTQLLGRQGAYH